jgi:hypothetical protein
MHLQQAWSELQKVKTESELRAWLSQRSKQNENQYLELKCRADINKAEEEKRANEGLKENVRKTLSAFSNSGGGILILGINDPKNRRVGLLKPLPDYENLIRSLTDSISKSFFPHCPTFQVVPLEDLELIAFLVSGSTTTKYLYENSDGFYGGYIRQGEQSITIAARDIYAYCMSWNEQTKLIEERRLSLRDRFDLDNSILPLNGTARFFIKALPVAPLPFESPASLSNIDLEDLQTIPDFLYLDNNTAESTEFRFIGPRTIVNNRWMSISRVGTGEFLINLCSDNPVDFDLGKHHMMCCVALYSALALSHRIDGASEWSIQGSYNLHLNRNHHPIRTPRLLPLRFASSKSADFPKMKNLTNVQKGDSEFIRSNSNDFYNLYSQIATILDTDPRSHFLCQDDAKRGNQLYRSLVIGWPFN